MKYKKIIKNVLNKKNRIYQNNMNNNNNNIEMEIIFFIIL